MDSNSKIRTVLNALHFSALDKIFGPSMGGRGAILMLHHVRDEIHQGFSPNSHLSVSPAFLEKLLFSLKKDGYEFVSMDKVADIMSGKVEQKKRFLSVTLDDAYVDNLEFAAPVFRKLDIPYTIYTAPGLVEGTAELWWEDLASIIASFETLKIDSGSLVEHIPTKTTEQKNGAFAKLINHFTTEVSEADQRKYVAALAKQTGVDQRAHVLGQVMSWDQLREISKDPLCTIGAHTVHHFAVGRLDAKDAKAELQNSADLIEKALGNRPEHFAYPYGYPLAAGPRDFEIAKELGFRSAVTTRHGVLYASHKNHLHALPRISLNGKFQKVRYVKTMLSGIPAFLSNKGRKLNIG